MTAPRLKAVLFTSKVTIACFIMENIVEVRVLRNVSSSFLN